jgi:F-type H+-transporting ATPase subunit beta
MNTGKIIQVMGPVVDVSFEGGTPPALYNAINVKRETDGKTETVVLEVALHLGNNTVRSVSMHPTDGLVRGMEAVDTGAPITVPVGEEVLGRILNVVGEPVDEKPAIESKEKWSISMSPFNDSAFLGYSKPLVVIVVIKPKSFASLRISGNCR